MGRGCLAGGQKPLRRRPAVVGMLMGGEVAISLFAGVWVFVRRVGCGARGRRCVFGQVKVCGVPQGREEGAAGVLVVMYPPQFSCLFVLLVMLGSRVWARVKHENHTEKECEGREFP